MNLSSRFTLRAVALAAGVLLAAVPPGFAVEIQPQGNVAAPVAAAPEPGADIDLFPSQSFDSLSPMAAAQAQIDVPPPPMEMNAAPEMDPPPPQEVPLPFASVAAWRDSKREAFAVEGLGQVFVFCGRCRVPGAVHPGETIADGYRLEKLDEVHATLLTPDGQERSLPLVGMTH
jgi:hypothetical protein